MENKIGLVYYLWLENEAKGPFTLGQVRTMWSNGQLTTEHSYTTDQGETWQELSNLITELEAIQVAIPSLSVAQVTETSVRQKGPLVFLLILLLAGLGLGLFLVSHSSARVSPASSQLAISPEIKLALNNLKSATDTGINQPNYTNLVIVLKSAVATYGNNLSAHQLSELHTILDDCDVSIQLWKASFVEDDGTSNIGLGSIGSGNANPSLDIAAALVWMRNHNINIHEGEMHATSEVMSPVFAVIDAEVDGFLKEN